jgi:hypothetical protein
VYTVTIHGVVWASDVTKFVADSYKEFLSDIFPGANVVIQHG